MSAEVWNTVFTGMFVLASAALGFFGSLIASNRSAKHALAQIRFDRVHARRDDVLGEVYKLLWDVEDAFRELVTFRGPPATKVEQMDKANRSIGLLMAGVARGFPWIPEQIGRQLITMAREYQDFMDDISRQVKRGPIDQGRYEAVFDKAKPRFIRMSQSQDHDGLLREMRDALGIENPAP